MVTPGFLTRVLWGGGVYVLAWAISLAFRNREGARLIAMTLFLVPWFALLYPTTQYPGNRDNTMTVSMHTIWAWWAGTLVGYVWSWVKTHNKITGANHGQR